MRVERTAADDRLGWVLTIYDDDNKARVEVRVSPGGRRWSVRYPDRPYSVKL
jgi:hypothetical protein